MGPGAPWELRMLDKATREALERRYYPELEEVVFARMRAALEQRLPHGARVLDSGSGPGSWVLQEQRARDAARIGLLVGQDVYRPDVTQLDAFVLARSEALPFAAGSFDLVLAYNVIEHLPDPAHALREIARVLVPGGVLALKTPAANAPLFLLARLLPTRMHKRLKGGVGVAADDVFPTYYRANSVRTLEHALRGTGLTRDWLFTVDQTYAYCSQRRWTYTLGLRYSRLTRCRALAWLRNQIVGFYRVAYPDALSKETP
jgi:SAM-dependent methyltransferase